MIVIDVLDDIEQGDDVEAAKVIRRTDTTLPAVLRDKLGLERLDGLRVRVGRQRAIGGDEFTQDADAGAQVEQLDWLVDGDLPRDRPPPKAVPEAPGLAGLLALEVSFEIAQPGRPGFRSSVSREDRETARDCEKVAKITMKLPSDVSEVMRRPKRLNVAQPGIALSVKSLTETTTIAAITEAAKTPEKRRSARTAI